MAKPELGIKRLCPVTGRKFYDLNRDPVVSPYSGQSYPRSYFEPQSKIAARDEEVEEEVATPVELVALEEVDAPEAATKEAAAAEDIDVDIATDDDNDDDTFLETDEEEDDDVSDLIDGDLADDEES